MEAKTPLATAWEVAFGIFKAFALLIVAIALAALSWQLLKFLVIQAALHLPPEVALLVLVFEMVLVFCVFVFLFVYVCERSFRKRNETGLRSRTAKELLKEAMKKNQQRQSSRDAS